MCSEGSGFGLSPVDHEPPGAATGKVVIRGGRGCWRDGAGRSIKGSKSKIFGFP